MKKNTVTMELLKTLQERIARLKELLEKLNCDKKQLEPIRIRVKK